MKIQYIRNEQKHPIGVLVAVKNEATATVHVGFSVLNSGDRWDKGLGVTIARQRALNRRSNEVPEKIEVPFKNFVDHLHGRKEYNGYRLPASTDFCFVGPRHRQAGRKN